MSDIVDRLLAADVDPGTVTSWRDLAGEAADEIERLRHDIDQCLAAANSEATEAERLQHELNSLRAFYSKAVAEIERLRAIRHKPEVGGPPCPTCGFVITHKKAEPLRFEDEP